MTDAEHLPLPPGRKGLPLLGETLTFLRDSTGFGADRVRRFGPIFRTHLFGQPTIVVSGAEAVRHVLRNEGKLFTARWPASTRRLLGQGSVAVQTGPVHAHRRGVIAQAFTPRVIRDQVPEIDRIAQEHLERWRQADSVGWAEALAEYTFHVAAGLLVGIEDDLEGFAALFRGWIAGLFSIPVNLPFTTYGKALARREALLSRIDALVARRQAEPPRPGARDALSALLAARDDDGSALPTDELSAQMLTLLFAGHDTSSSALASLALVLSTEPGRQEALRAEQRAFDPAAPIAADALTRMPRLAEVVDETLRIYPPVAAGFRTVLRTHALDGYRIPEGWAVNYHIRSTHWDPAQFPEPASFRPERFAGQSRAPSGFLPFGSGPRVCVGMALARAEIMVLGARLMRGPGWRLLPDQDLSLQHFPVPRPRGGLMVRFD